jgi:dethiobiotin synthetase
MNVIFIAGTDTGVGKTFITELLSRRLKRSGYNVAVQKWVETGVRKSEAVYSFKLASSPHLAAKSEGKTINIAKIKKELKKLSKKFDFVIVEGTGGLLVPITSGKLFIDIVKELKLPVLLVSANKLGTINHTLLSIEALKAREINVLGVIFNNIDRRENRLILKDNPKIVKKLIGKIPVWINGWQKI